MSGLLLLMAGIPSAQAQTHSTADPSVTISGTVLDTSGAVIPNAEIKLTAVETSVATTASDQGQFSIHTKPGDYVLKVSSLGFRPYEQSIHVVSSSEEQLRVILQVCDGSRVDSCSVCFNENAPAPLLNASLSSTIPLQYLPPLPLHRKSLKRLSH